MTKKIKNTKEATQFSEWLRKQVSIDSNKGYIVTDLDFIWENYKTNEFMLIKEKRKMNKMTWVQEKQFKRIDSILKHSTYYKGFYLIQFQNTNPDDGKIFWNYKEISKEELIEKLQFKNVDIKSSYFK
jgi:hypothetical protein